MGDIKCAAGSECRESRMGRVYLFSWNLDDVRGKTARTVGTALAHLQAISRSGDYVGFIAFFQEIGATDAKQLSVQCELFFGDGKAGVLASSTPTAYGERQVIIASKDFVPAIATHESVDGRILLCKIPWIGRTLWVGGVHRRSRIHADEAGLTAHAVENRLFLEKHVQRGEDLLLAGDFNADPMEHIELRSPHALNVLNSHFLERRSEPVRSWASGNTPFDLHVPRMNPAAGHQTAHSYLHLGQRLLIDFFAATEPVARRFHNGVVRGSLAILDGADKSQQITVWPAAPSKRLSDHLPIAIDLEHS